MSNMWTLNSYDIKSFLIYAAIIAAAMAIPYLPELQWWLVLKGIPLGLAGYLISVLWVLFKKIVQGAPIPTTES